MSTGKSKTVRPAKSVKPLNGARDFARKLPSSPGLPSRSAEQCRMVQNSNHAPSQSSLLRELHISNLAVIADARIELSPGLNCFTGATGAGKSLVIGALELLLGLRSPNDMLRKGADEGRVSGLFELHDPVLRQKVSTLTDVPLPTPELLLTRRLFPSNRSTVSLNGQPITLAMLRAAAEHLVDVHGQHDHQYLLRPSNQLQVLDEYAGTLPLRAKYEAIYTQLQTSRKRLDELTQGRTLRQQQLELYRFQAGEIDAAELAAGECESLSVLANKLNNVEKLQREAGSLHAALVESDAALVEQVKSMSATLADLAALDPALVNISATIRDAALSIEEGARDLERYLNKLDLDPEQLAQANDRLTTIHRLASKYASRALAGMPASAGMGNDDAAKVLAYREELRREIETLEQQTEDLSILESSLAPLEREARALAESLSQSRQTAARKLAKQVESALKDLGLERAIFSIHLNRTETPPAPGAGIPSAPALSTGTLTVTGLDTIEFLTSPNPGLPPSPLRKIASGGELSRIMLALKGILSANDRVSVLVFDEIDSNVGGRLGSIIGTKLRALATNHQVLCITHLPQIAAYAHRHLTVRKSQSADETTSTVAALAGDAQLNELAEMISGTHITDVTRAQAKELLSAAQQRSAET